MYKPKKTEQRLPDYLIRPGHSLADRRRIKKHLRAHGLHTVCESARCPNIEHCFSIPTATYLILGDSCLRGCRFCAVTQAKQLPPDTEEPKRVAEAARELGLKHVVITSVTRDDLPDGGAAHFAATITAVRELLPEAKVEVLVPDFQGRTESISVVLEAGPDVFNHNIETVPGLYSRVRPAAEYRRSLDVLARAAKDTRQVKTKSGLMVGFGETEQEVLQVLNDLRSAAVEILTVGQYLRPTRNHLPVSEYRTPEYFKDLKRQAYEMGFAAVACAPLVRSSFDAAAVFSSMEEK
jgi:lipoyl synthase